MRDDYQHAASMLRTLGDAIKACPPAHKARLSAYIIKLGLVASKNAIVSAAILELTHKEQADEAQLLRRTEDVEERATAWFKAFVELMRPLREDLSTTGILDQLLPLPARAATPATFQEARKKVLVG